MSKTQRIISNNFKTLITFGIYSLLLWGVFAIIHQVLTWALSNSFLFFVTLGLLAILGSSIILSIVSGWLGGTVGAMIIENRILSKGFYVITGVIFTIIGFVKLIKLLSFDSLQPYLALLFFLISSLIILIPSLPKRTNQ
jgi:hypothetical protein